MLLKNSRHRKCIKNTWCIFEKLSKTIWIVVNYEKLNWMNEQYLRAMPDSKLLSKAQVILKEAGREVDDHLLSRALIVEKGRMTHVNDILGVIGIYVDPFNYDPELLVWKKADATDAKQQLMDVRALLDTLPEASFETVEEIDKHLMDHMEKNDLQKGNVLWPLRVALSGAKASPSPFELLWVFGKIESLRRIDEALNKLS